MNETKKPLHKMTLPELKAEHSFREAIRYSYDRDDEKTHKVLKANLDEVRRYIQAVERGEKIDPNDF